MASPRFLHALRFCLLLPLLTACGGDDHSSPPLGSGELRWANFPVQIYVDKALIDDPDASEDLLDAVAFWHSLAGKSLFSLVGVWTGSSPFVGDPADPESILANGIFFVGPWPYDAAIAGRTLVYSEGTAIHSSAVMLNPDTRLCSDDCDGPGEGEMTSRRKLLAHELGHFLGFNHTGDPSDLMYPAILPGGSLDSVTVDTRLLHTLTN